LPRSTCTHCGSLNALDQRVVGSLSVTLPGPNVALSLVDAVAVLPAATLLPQLAWAAGALL
jgi:hypothetical protein